jgi:hypothetical protein
MSRSQDLKPGLNVVQAFDHSNRPMTVIIQCHRLPPHDPVAQIEITTASDLQALIRRLRHRLDVILEETRARVRPESCGSGFPVERRPTLDELDGD